MKKTKRILSLILALCLCMALVSAVLAVDSNSNNRDQPLLSSTIQYNDTVSVVLADQKSAMPTNDRLTVNGAVQNPTVYKIDGSNYFKLRDLAAILNGTGKQFAVGYDGTSKSVTVTTGKGYTAQGGELAGAASKNETAIVSNDAIIIDGTKIQVEVYKIGGSNYFKLRDLGRALDFYVGYDKAHGMFIESNKPYPEYGERTVRGYYPDLDRCTITFSSAIIEEQTITVKEFSSGEEPIEEYDDRSVTATIIKLAPGSYVTVPHNPLSDDSYFSKAVSSGGFLKNNCYEMSYSESVDGFLSGTAEEIIGREYDFIWLNTDQFDTEFCFMTIGS